MSEKGSKMLDLMERVAMFHVVFSMFSGHKPNPNATTEEKLGEMGAVLGKKLAPKFAKMSIDEFLALSAAKRAMTKHKISKKQVIDFFKVIGTLDREERDKITDILSHGEEAVVVEVITKDKDGKDIVNRTTRYENVRGGEIFAMLATLSPDDLRSVLMGAGAMDTLSEDFEEVFEKISSFCKKIVDKIPIDQVAKCAGGSVRSLSDFIDERNRREIEKMRKNWFVKIFFRPPQLKSRRQS